MIGFLIRRVLLLALMLFGLVVLTFCIANVAPADPAALAAGPDATPDMIATIRHEYGLDRPLPVQFLRYVGDLARLRLGRSIQTGDEVTADLARFAPPTFELVLTAITLATCLGVVLGTLAAVRRGGWFDNAVSLFAISGVALPAFWAALLAQLLFSVRLGWLPTSGQLGVATPPPPAITGMVVPDALLAGRWHALQDGLLHLILPAVVLSLPCLASILRVTRAEMIEVLASDHVAASRAQGIGAGRVIFVLALKNAMLPTLAMIGLRFGWMLGSTVLVETVFDWPGIGLYAVNSAIASDFKPVMGVTLLVGLAFMLANLAVDLAYGALDPRTRAATRPASRAAAPMLAVAADAPPT